MRPVSAEFLDQVTDSHNALVDVGLVTAGGDGFDLDVVDGSVTLDLTAANRGACSITVVNEDGTLTPQAASDSLTPYGAELVVRRGIRLADGSTELVSLGRFIIDTVDVDDTEGLQLRIEARDRSARMSDEKFEEPFQIAAGTPIPNAVAQVVHSVFPAAAINSVSTDLVTPFVLAVEEGSDKLELAQNLALAMACDFYFDGDGVPTLRQAGSNDVKAEITEGLNGVLIQASKNWTRAGISNRVIVTGENSGETPARGIATDDDPSSPTYYGGPFGKVPRFESLDFVITDDQAKDVAKMLLDRGLGVTQGVSFGFVPNPALEPDDVIQITRARAGIDESHVIDTLDIPLTPDGTMTGTTRLHR